MIRRSPAENYFRYLVAHPNCFDNKYIKDDVRESKLIKLFASKEVTLTFID